MISRDPSRPELPGCLKLKSEQKVFIMLARACKLFVAHRSTVYFRKVIMKTPKSRISLAEENRGQPVTCTETP